jgi:3-dehydroquinate synthase
MKLYTTYNLLEESHFLKAIQETNRRIALITDEKVGALYGKPFLSFLSQHEIPCEKITFPSGEKHKTRKTKEAIEDQLLAKKFGRDTLLIVMGGGVTLDLGGFVAATYCRGIPFLSIPTSLLAMVDASIGGKTGVNVKEGKNLIGAFHFPEALFIDFSMLSTLQDKEVLSSF